MYAWAKCLNEHCADRNEKHQNTTKILCWLNRFNLWSFLCAWSRCSFPGEVFLHVGTAHKFHIGRTARKPNTGSVLCCLCLCIAPKRLVHEIKSFRYVNWCVCCTFLVRSHDSRKCIIVILLNLFDRVLLIHSCVLQPNGASNQNSWQYFMYFITY